VIGKRSLYKSYEDVSFSPYKQRRSPLWQGNRAMLAWGKIGGDV
jgi:hypothetical protein